MLQHYTNVLSQEDINYILNLPEVLDAKIKIDSKTEGSVYFSILLTPSIKTTISNYFNLDLSNIESIPMRWIKGDTKPHVDKGIDKFENTYLMYLTNSIGELILGQQSFPISQGHAYMFNEGLTHETIGTGSEPRLLLGPMSEKTFAVGAAPTTIYIRQNGINIEYSEDNTIWNQIDFPFNLYNNYVVQFVTDITLKNSNNYFICNGGYITIGSPSLKEDGTRPIITINNVTNYRGLVQNGTNLTNGYNDIFIFNIDVRIVNGSTLADKGGWIGQKYFGKEASNNYIINCCSNGPIGSASSEGGGIVGSYVAIGLGSNLTLIGCSSSGDIGINSGGIVGTYAGNNSNPIPPEGGTITCQSCWSTGNILGYGGGTNGSGGIFGEYAGDKGIANAIDCYSMGSIGTQCGGIYARFAGRGGTSVATNCYSRGSIATSGGGIYAHYAGPTGNDGIPANVSAINCYSAGSVATSGNGIYGSNKINGTATNCYIANGSFSTPSASSALTGIPSNAVGEIWISRGVNQPYELRNIGYTPYSNNILGEGGFVTLYTETIEVGSSSKNALISDRSYSIVEIRDGDSGSYGTITINSITGAISTTSSTVSGIYTIFIRNTGSYHHSIVELTVESSSQSIEVNKNILENVTLNSANNGDGKISEGEFNLFNHIFRKLNDMYKDSPYINLIRNIHRNEINKFNKY